MYNASRISELWFLPALMLSVYTWGYFRPAYIRCSNVSVPAGSERYRWHLENLYPHHYLKLRERSGGVRDEDIGERAMEREIKRRVKLPLDDDERTARGRWRECKKVRVLLSGFERDQLWEENWRFRVIISNRVGFDPTKPQTHMHYNRNGFRLFTAVWTTVKSLNLFLL